MASYGISRFLRRGWLLTVVLCLVCAPAQAGKVLSQVKAKGIVQCGVSNGVAGFSFADSKGEWAGLDVDVCRAVAAAVLGDAKKVNFVPLNAQQRFTALQSGEVDVLSRNTSWTLQRDAGMGLSFAAITFYDGQGFLVPKKLKITDARQLKGVDVCVQSGTTNEKNVAEYFRANGIKSKSIVFDSFEAAYKAFFSGRCQAFSTDASALAGLKNKEASKPDDYLILPTLISKEPLGPLVKRGDDDWLAVVRWTVYALIEAEELGVTARQVDTLKSSADPAIRRLLGAGDDMGKPLGLDKEWAYRAIKAVGNYGEVFDRNVGQGSPLKLPRGANQLWNKGGLLYAPPVR